MVDGNGWIMLYRKLIDNPIFLKPELLQLWVYCLLKANHKENKIIFNKLNFKKTTAPAIKTTAKIQTTTANYRRRV